MTYGHPKRRDEPEYAVTLTIRLTTTVRFARGEGLDDDAEILPSDAVANAIGLLPTDLTFGGEFDNDPDVTGEADLI
jgi:hypothetical protein